MKKSLFLPFFAALVVACGGGGGGGGSIDSEGPGTLGRVFYPTITNNSEVDTTVGFFEIVVSNPSETLTANVQVTRGAVALTTQQVPPGEARIITLPWITQLLSAGTTVVVDGAYRVESDEPVAVYQYNPLNYTDGVGGYTVTNEASLLLPGDAWGTASMVVARSHFSGTYPGFYAVTAGEDNTTVTVTPSGSGSLVTAGAGIEADGTGTVVLDRGDVLHVASRSGGADPDPSDLTGTLVTADKPVQVIGGHSCTNIPWDVAYCDHLEESMIPLQSAGTSYVVAAPWIAQDTVKARIVRIIATEDNTALSYDPPITGAPGLLDSGAYAEIAQTTSSFMITADRKILVAQYMLGQEGGGGAGDPSMVLAVPVSQYVSEHTFHAPVNYETNYVNIIAPSGASVTLDGAAVTGSVDIGTSGFNISRVQLSNTGNGNHTVSATSPVSVSVYGYGLYTSYWYPAGMNLDIL